MRLAFIISLCPAVFLVSCGEAGNSKRTDENLPTSFMYHCIISTEIGDGSFARINGQIIDVVTSKSDMYRLAKAVSNITERKTLYGRVCVKGVFAYKKGFIGHMQDRVSPRKFINLFNFEIISSDNNLDDVYAIIKKGTRLPPRGD